MPFKILQNNVVDIIYGEVNKIKSQTYEPDEAIATSLLGTPIYSNLQIQNGQYEDVVTGEIIKYNGLRIDSALFVVDRQKNIVITEVQGRNGSVKELISSKDYSVSISGLLIDPRINVAPVDQKNTLIKIDNAQTSIEIISSFLNDFGIYNLVITNSHFEEVQGHRNVIRFSLNCLSDVPYDLEILEETNS